MRRFLTHFRCIKDALLKQKSIQTQSLLNIETINDSLGCGLHRYAGPHHCADPIVTQASIIVRTQSLHAPSCADSIATWRASSHGLPICVDWTRPGWTRNYEYKEESQLEPGKRNNRLSRTTISSISEDYLYEDNDGWEGNITSMPNLRSMRWDYQSQLQATACQIVAGISPETTWYVYDDGGRRVRKVTDRQATTSESAVVWCTCFEESDLIEDTKLRELRAT